MNRPPFWLKPAVHTALFLPLLYLLLAWGELLWVNPASDRLGYEPVERTHNLLGLWSIRILLLALAITPINRLTGWTPVMSLRRMTGLWAFTYAAAHLLFFLTLELDFSLVALWNEAMKRNFILFGLAAFLCLLPLALTSTRAAIKRLGGRNWQRLHRLAYLAGIGACVHFILRVKGFQLEPYIYSAILGLVFAIRFMPSRKRASRASRLPA